MATKRNVLSSSINNGTHSLLQSDIQNPLRRPLNITEKRALGTKPQRPNYVQQQIAFNINNRSTRLTFWSIIILIVSIAEINMTLSMWIYYQTYKKQFDPDIDPDPYNGTRTLDIISVISDAFLLIAAALILFGIHKSMTHRIITSIMFVIGSIMHLVHCILGMQLYCVDDPTKPEINNDNAFCRLSFMGSDLYLEVFLIFYCMDIIKSIGDRIRTRVFIHSMLLSAVGFMNCGNSFHADSEFKKDAALMFASTVVATGYLIIALITVFIFTTFCLVYCSYWLVMSDTEDGYTCNTSYIVRKIVSGCLLFALGMVLTSPYIYIFVTGSVDEIGTPPIHSLTYYMIALVLLVYDLQYVT